MIGQRGVGQRGVGQRGVALITAIILVAIAAVLATAIGFGSAMSARRASTTFGADQSFLAAEGAEALAAVALKLTSRSNGTYLPQDQWAQPYGPVELTDGVLLEFAQIEDESSKFNINNLAPNGTTNQSMLKLFQRLLARVSVEQKWAGLIADWIDSDNTPNTPDGAEDSVYLSQTPPYRTANLAVTSISELLALPGFGRDRYDRIAPFITALPPGTGINVCTASGVLLDALADKTEYSTDPAALANERMDAKDCFPPVQVFVSTLSSEVQSEVRPLLGTTTSYFRLRSFITIGTARFTLYSLLYRDNNGQFRPILRTFGTE
jgi:general secretion pathway protein K